MCNEHCKVELGGRSGEGDLSPDVVGGARLAAELVEPRLVVICARS